MSKVCQLFSGSSGNSIYISCSQAKILVDAGVTAKRIETALAQIGEDAKSIDAIFITHEHTDHISGVRVLASRYGIPVFAPNAVLEKMWENGSINNKVTAFCADSTELCGVDITPFALSHDSVECVGYKFVMPDKRKISVCTDTGFVTPQAREMLMGSDLVFLESNHEITMVENGSYPYVLKQRILSSKGHLSNVACAEFATELAKNGTTRFVLSHLSRENNHPLIARETTYSALVQNGFEENRDFRLYVSSQQNTERPIIL